MLGSAGASGEVGDQGAFRHEKNWPPGQGFGQGFFLMCRSLCVPLKLFLTPLLARLWRGY